MTDSKHRQTNWFAEYVRLQEKGSANLDHEEKRRLLELEAIVEFVEPETLRQEVARALFECLPTPDAQPTSDSEYDEQLEVATMAETGPVSAHQAVELPPPVQLRAAGELLHVGAKSHKSVYDILKKAEGGEVRLQNLNPSLSRNDRLFRVSGGYATLIVSKDMQVLLNSQPLEDGQGFPIDAFKQLTLEITEDDGKVLIVIS